MLRDPIAMPMMMMMMMIIIIVDVVVETIHGLLY